MACSDDDGRTLLLSLVCDYSLVDDNDEPVSFCELPLIWDDSARLEDSGKEISLRGHTDNGLRRVFEQVTAWKFDTSYALPEIFVLSKKKNWVKLLKPRKSFEKTIRTVLITVHCLHFLTRNPRSSEKDLWDYLAKIFRLYEPRPSENDLVDHRNLIGEAVKRDVVLGRSKILVNFLQKEPQKNEVYNEVVGKKSLSSFIVGDHITDKKGKNDSGEEDKDLYESVCAICDNGGDLICCEGRCRRAFHATKAAGSDSACESLGFSEEQVRQLATLECKNYQYKQHQCYICGKLGSSDKSAGAEVFQCTTGSCGYFYHPHCVAKVLRSECGERSKDIEDKITAGEPFMCPIHICHACKGRERKSKGELKMQFAVCRRCPRAYHRICLPRKIVFEEDEDKDIVQRAWEGLMPNKILIYCLKHEIDYELQTAARNHIRFPATDQQKKMETVESVGRSKNLRGKRVDAAEDVCREKVVSKQSQGTDKLKRPADYSSTRDDRLSKPTPLKKQKLDNNSKVATSVGESKTFAENQLEVPEPREEKSDLNEQEESGEPVTEESETSMILDADSKRRILSILREAESSITMADVALKYQASSRHAFSSKHVIQSMRRENGKLKGKGLQCPEYPAGSLSFATGLYRPFSQRNTAGWLEE